jgi:hypothetical protein
MQHVWGRGEAYTGFRWENMTERDNLGEPSVHGMMIIKMDLQEEGCGGMD